VSAQSIAFLLNLINDGSIDPSPEMKEQLVAKARHMLRDSDTGKFRRMNDHENHTPGDESLPLPVLHSGAVLDVLRRRSR
jgi:hypothetical protein